MLCENYYPHEDRKLAGYGLWAAVIRECNEWWDHMLTMLPPLETGAHLS